jgi:NAD-dependent dihydropyrimidine dehydrogenase PreA subunit
MSENRVEINPDQCKGCRLCVETCPNDCLVISSEINALGYQPAKFDNPSCTACSLCFYICPEPGAITVIKADKKKQVKEK